MCIFRNTEGSHIRVCKHGNQEQIGVADSFPEGSKSVESEVQHLRQQLDDMRTLLLQTQSNSTTTLQDLSHSQQPSNRTEQTRRDSVCDSHGSSSHFIQQQEENGAIVYTPRALRITLADQMLILGLCKLFLQMEVFGAFNASTVKCRKFPT